jgi:AcrR family transcriptional regulator
MNDAIDELRKPSQPRAKRTWQRLVEAAAAQFSRHGHAATTTKSIAEAAGVATGTLYQYFTDKDALLHEIARLRVRDVPGAVLNWVATTEGPPPTRAEAVTELERVVGVVMQQHQRDPGLHAVLTERRHADPVLDELVSRSEAALVEGIAQRLASWGHPGDHMATAFVLFSMVEGAVHAHVLGHAVVDDPRFIAALVDALIAVALGHAESTASKTTPSCGPTRGKGPLQH